LRKLHDVKIGLGKEKFREDVAMGLNFLLVVGFGYEKDLEI